MECHTVGFCRISLVSTNWINTQGGFSRSPPIGCSHSRNKAETRSGYHFTPPFSGQEGVILLGSSQDLLQSFIIVIEFHSKNMGRVGEMIDIGDVCVFFFIFLVPKKSLPRGEDPLLFRLQTQLYLHRPAVAAVSPSVRVAAVLEWSEDSAIPLLTL